MRRSHLTKIGDERDVICERAIAGLQAASARGRKGGRKHAFTASKLHRVPAAMASRDANFAELLKSWV
jgi:hypothetical protein